MKASEVAAVAKTLELIEKNPPTNESWERGYGQPTLAQHLRDWMKENL